MIYFAYGADLNPSRMAQNAPGYRSLGAARLKGWWITFPRYSAIEQSAVIGLVQMPGAVVWGALYEVPDADIPILDSIFGFDPDAPPNLNEYVRQDVEVERINRQNAAVAETYVAVPDNERRQPSQAYMALVQDGARYHGLPKAYLGALHSVRTSAA